MPSADILIGLTSLANDWRALSILWHVFLASLSAALLAGWRPPTRLLARLFILPLASVGALAWLSGNPFNGTSFALLTGSLAWATRRSPERSLQFAGPCRLAAGMALIAFGWIYPHFLETDTWASYLYAAPFGLLPCPTLSTLVGLTLLVRGLHSKSWSGPLVTAGVVYGAVGVFYLGVSLDWVLLVASVTLAGISGHHDAPSRSVAADPAERQRPLPGDGFIVGPLASLTHGVTIRCAPQSVWPWLVQMGAGYRAGWYSYDVIDNGGRPSVNRVVPELQDIGPGTLFPALPGETNGFTVLACDPPRSLVLAWPCAQGEPLVTWSFVLQERPDGATRLLVRVRGGHDYSFRGLPPWLSRPIAQLVHFVMQRQQLLGIARRAEGAQPC